MRIFTRKAFGFRKPGTSSAQLLKETGCLIRTRPLEFIDVPGWVQDTATFTLARKAGLVEVVDSKEQEVKIEAMPAPKKEGKKTPLPEKD